MRHAAAPVPAAARQRPTVVLRQRIAWHPEWWALALCAAAWSALLSPAALSSAGAAFCRHPDAATSLDTVSAAAGWAVMIAAMMLPLVILPVRRAAFASLWRRRHRAVAGFLLGYGLCWIIAGAGGVALLAGLHIDSAATARGAALALVAAAFWELTPLKRRALSLCHREIPLRPYGWRADLDCLRFGAIRARSCLASCWAMMLGTALAPDHLPAMAAVTAIASAQIYLPRRDQRLEAVLLAILALGCAVRALG